MTPESNVSLGQDVADTNVSQMQILEAILDAMKTRGQSLEAAVKDVASVSAEIRHALKSVVKDLAGLSSEVSKVSAEIRSLSEAFRTFSSNAPSSLWAIGKKSPFQVSLWNILVSLSKLA